MSEYFLFGKIGFDHIVDWAALDHILFLVALIAGVFWEKQKMLLALITAFTIGHSITLFFGTFHLLRIPSAWVEFLIPLTIVISASLNLVNKNKRFQSFSYYHFIIILFFGFIHGMGFAGDLRSMLAQSDSIFIPLFSMNVGLELGQIFIVSLLWVISYFFLTYTNIDDKKRRQYLSIFALVGGIYFTILNLLTNG